MKLIRYNIKNTKNPRDAVHEKGAEIIRQSMGFHAYWKPYIMGVNILHQMGRILNGTRKRNDFYTGRE